MAVYTQSVLSPDPLYLQPKSYDARADRKWFADLVTPGVVGSGDYNVTATSGNMNIIIAAGIAWCLGQNIADQGMYRQYISSQVTMTVPNNSSGNPRIDTVILRMMDNTHDSSTYNEARLEIVPGTPTAGATLANLNGKANLTTLGEASKSVLLLAYVLVPNNATVLTTAGNILDARVRAFIGSAGIPLGNLWTFATTPPASPVNGNVWVYTGISGQYWIFIYDSSQATYKWLYVGGPPVIAEVTGSGTVTTAGSYVAPPNGPDITLARAGIYDIEVDFMSVLAAGNGPMYHSYQIGATSAQDIDAAVHNQQTANASSMTTMSRKRRNTLSSASTTVGARYKCGTGTTNTVYNRTMHITPVAVI